MSGIRFEWDPHKASLNERKHGISFDEAQSAFYDDCARLIGDPDHSQDEERFVLLGLSKSIRLLSICHCYKRDGRVIRIFSARKATSSESKAYQRGEP
ncbi:MAG: BrnT family toxin [Betaproteobacteria bacterium]